MNKTTLLRRIAQSIVICGCGALCQPASAQVTLYSNGFETDTFGWTSVNRVPSGTGGISSSSGSFHGTVATGAGSFTRWGGANGYNFGAGNAVPTPFLEYWTSVDIYLDVNSGLANDTRFDFSSAINNSAGTHLRDFIFNAGFYNDTDASPGSGTNRFVISASNNAQRADAYAKNPGRSPIAISSTGWYAFGHHFYDNAGVLAVDLTITDAADNPIASWTLSNPADLIAGVGGNRYGWFDINEAPLAIDNSELRVAAASVPEPGSTAALLAIALLALAIAGRRFSSHA